MNILVGFVVLLMGSSAQAGDSLESLMQALSSDDVAARAEAACRIGRLGFRAKGAMTALVELLSDASAVEDIDCDHRGWHNSAGRWETSPGRQAARALADSGNRSFDPLVLALDGSSWVARKNAAFALGRLENKRHGRWDESSIRTLLLRSSTRSRKTATIASESRPRGPSACWRTKAPSRLWPSH